MIVPAPVTGLAWSVTVEPGLKIWPAVGAGDGHHRRGGSAPQLHVSGNKLLSSTGAQVVLHGVDRSGTEYACVQGNGIFDGPIDQASISAMKTWGVNAVRVPLNEACWNAESYVNAGLRGRQLPATRSRRTSAC